jgi:hypothetical protein
MKLPTHFLLLFLFSSYSITTAFAAQPEKSKEFIQAMDAIGRKDTAFAKATCEKVIDMNNLQSSDPWCAVLLGSEYYKSQYGLVQNDLTKAIPLLKFAAANEIKAANDRLGDIYWDGLPPSIDQDRKQAFLYYQNGGPASARKLGLAFASGVEGIIIKDEVTAYKLMNYAASNGDSIASKVLKEWKQGKQNAGTADVVSTNQYMKITDKPCDVPRTSFSRPCENGKQMSQWIYKVFYVHKDRLFTVESYSNSIFGQRGKLRVNPDGHPSDSEMQLLDFSEAQPDLLTGKAREVYDDIKLTNKIANAKIPPAASDVSGIRELELTDSDKEWLRKSIHDDADSFYSKAQKTKNNSSELKYSAYLGHADAAADLAKSFVARSSESAQRLYELAIKRGSAKGYLGLADMYRDAKNIVKAIPLYEEAGKRKNQDAINSLAYISQKQIQSTPQEQTLATTSLAKLGVTPEMAKNIAMAERNRLERVLAEAKREHEQDCDFGRDLIWKNMQERNTNAVTNLVLSAQSKGCSVDMSKYQPKK